MNLIQQKKLILTSRNNIIYPNFPIIVENIAKESRKIFVVRSIIKISNNLDKAIELKLISSKKLMQDKKSEEDFVKLFLNKF